MNYPLTKEKIEDMLYKMKFEDSGRRGMFFTNWIISPKLAEAFDKAIKEECERLGYLPIQSPVQEKIIPKPVGFMRDENYIKMINESLEKVYNKDTPSLEDQINKQTILKDKFIKAAKY